jgi:uncharacterized protein (DUF1810 family)
LARFVDAQRGSYARPLAEPLDIFGSPDDMKLRSCATLFAEVSAQGSPFHRLLGRYFDGKPDEATLRILSASSSARRGP